MIPINNIEREERNAIKILKLLKLIIKLSKERFQYKYYPHNNGNNSHDPKSNIGWQCRPVPIWVLRIWLFTSDVKVH